MDAVRGISSVLGELEVLSGDEFIELDVASGELVDQIGGGLGDDLVLVGVAVRAVPGSQELLVDVVGVLPGGEARLVGGGDPVARGVGRVDLVDQTDHSVLVLPELVLGVHQDQPVLVGHLLPEREQLARLLRAVVPVLLRHEAPLDHVLRRDQLVVLVRLGRRRDQVLPELLVLLESLRQVDAAVLPHSVLVVRPQRRRRRPRDVPAHHELDRERRALPTDRHVRVGDRQHVVRHDVLRLLEPPRRGQVQHLALERHRAQLAVKPGHAVRRDQHHFVVALEAVTHLPHVQVLHVDALQVRLRQRVRCWLPSLHRTPTTRLVDPAEIRLRTDVGVRNEQSLLVLLLDLTDTSRDRLVAQSKDLRRGHSCVLRIQNQHGTHARGHADRRVQIHTVEGGTVRGADNHGSRDVRIRKTTQGVRTSCHSDIHLRLLLSLVSLALRNRFHNNLQKFQQTSRSFVSRGDSHLTVDTKVLRRHGKPSIKYLDSFLDLLAVRKITLGTHKNYNKRRGH